MYNLKYLHNYLILESKFVEVISGFSFFNMCVHKREKCDIKSNKCIKLNDVTIHTMRKLYLYLVNVRYRE